jgi:hypothetical protein
MSATYCLLYTYECKEKLQVGISYFRTEEARKETNSGTSNMREGLVTGLRTSSPSGLVFSLLSGAQRLTLNGVPPVLRWVFSAKFVPSPMSSVTPECNARGSLVTAELARKFTPARSINSPCAEISYPVQDGREARDTPAVTVTVPLPTSTSTECGEKSELT